MEQFDDLLVMVGLTSLIVSDLPMLPRLDPKRARLIIAKIDNILAWENSVENTRDSKFVDLGKHLCEVRAGQYWRMEQLKSFDEFLEKRFPESRRKAYYLMSIHEHLPKQIKKDLPEIGWVKAVELIKIARSDRNRFDWRGWTAKAQAMPREQFRHEVEKHLTGEDSEPSDMIYFKLYKSQIPVVEEAIETAALMLGSDKSRGYCLEMICADFLAGAHASGGDPNVVLEAVLRTYKLTAVEGQVEFLTRVQRHAA
ncbi:MAG: hypothetical protein ACJ71Q_10370 [Terriglobales bacterium]